MEVSTPTTTNTRTKLNPFGDDGNDHEDKNDSPSANASGCPTTTTTAATSNTSNTTNSQKESWCAVCQEVIQAAGCRTFGKFSPCGHRYHDDCLGGFHYEQAVIEFQKREREREGHQQQHQPPHHHHYHHHRQAVVAANEGESSSPMDATTDTDATTATDAFVELFCPTCGIAIHEWHRHHLERDLRSELSSNQELQASLALPQESDDLSVILTHIRTKLWSPNPKEVAAAMRMLVKFASADIDDQHDHQDRMSQDRMSQDDTDEDDDNDNNNNNNDDDNNDEEEENDDDEEDEQLVKESYRIGLHIVLIRVLERFSDRENICDMVLGIIEWMVGGEDTEESRPVEVWIRQSCAMQCLLTTMKTYIVDSSTTTRGMIYNGLSCWQKLCRSSPLAKQALYSAGAVDVSFQILQKSKEDFMMQEICILFLNQFTQEAPYALFAVGKYPQASHWISVYLNLLQTAGDAAGVPKEDDGSNDEDDDDEDDDEQGGEVDWNTIMSTGELLFRLVEQVPAFCHAMCQGPGAKSMGLLYKQYKGLSAEIQDVYGQTLKCLVQARVALHHRQQQQQQQQQHQAPDGTVTPFKQMPQTDVPSQALVEQAATMRPDQISALKRTAMTEPPPTPPTT